MKLLAARRRKVVNYSLWNHRFCRSWLAIEIGDGYCGPIMGRNGRYSLKIEFCGCTVR